MAYDKELDLVEISPSAKPPVCKLMDLGKYKYEMKKKAQVTRKKQHIQQYKEIQLRPRTDEHDLQTKLKHARVFLERGDKVVVRMLFRGRELARMEIGRTLLDRVVKELDSVSKLESPARRLGRVLTITLAPKK